MQTRPLLEPHPLSAIDHAFAGLSVSIVLRFGARLDAERLSRALDTALRAVPPLTSGLRELPDERCAFAPLASPPAAWLDVRDAPELPEEPCLPDALDAWLPRLAAGLDQPLFAARLTRAPSGSILAATVSHAAADGYSLFLLMRAWSQAALGRAIQPPLWDRRLLDVAPEPSAALTPGGVWERTGLSWVPGWGRAPADAQPASPAERLVPPDPTALGAGLPLTKNALLCAWLIQALAPQLAGPDGLKVAFPVDYRRCFGGRLDAYFGNAVRMAPLVVDRGRLERATLPELAAEVQAAVHGVLDQRGARASLACLEQLRRERGLAGVRELHPVDPHDGLLVTNMSRLPLAMLDFGGGPPARALLPATWERTAVIQQGERGIEVSLSWRDRA
ncbi:acyltransferase [Sorangium sp. So ce726]|uniref:acyltransferase n=1 Tax=Sorangium sp. So ce726 TaxID=3133319 RepID=UPI003F6320C8